MCESFMHVLVYNGTPGQVEPCLRWRAADSTQVQCNQVSELTKTDKNRTHPVENRMATACSRNNVGQQP